MTMRGERGPERGDGSNAIVLLGCAGLIAVFVAGGAVAFFALARRAPPPPASAPMPVSVALPSGSGVLDGPFRVRGVPATEAATPSPTPPAPTSPVIRPDELPTEGMSPEIVSRVIQGHRAQVAHCYERELTSDPTFTARVELHLTIAPDGTVSSATADGSPRTELTDCIAARARGWTFPSNDGGGVTTINYPFVFTAG